MDQLVDEIVKLTWQDVYDTDSDVEKLRKLNERNFNWRMQTHVKDALQLAVALYTRYSCPIQEPMPYPRAVELSLLIQKAYRG
jgi:hypothetical protein